LRLTNHFGKGGRMKVKFLGASKEQINWGGNNDPNKVLKIGKIYEVLEKEVHSWHTKISLIGFDGKKFNDASFEYIK